MVFSPLVFHRCHKQNLRFPMRDLLALSVVLLPRLMKRLVIRSDFHLHHRHSGSHSRIPADPSGHIGVRYHKFWAPLESTSHCVKTDFQFFWSYDIIFNGLDNIFVDVNSVLREASKSVIKVRYKTHNYLNKYISRCFIKYFSTSCMWLWYFSNNSSLIWSQ